MAKSKVETVDTTEENSTDEVKTSTPVVRMYLGPNLFTRGLMQYQVFIGELPTEVKQFAEEREPDVIKLFVSVNEGIGQSIKEVNTPDTLLHIYWNRVQDAYIKEVNEHGI